MKKLSFVWLAIWHFLHVTMWGISLEEEFMMIPPVELPTTNKSNNNHGGQNNNQGEQNGNQGGQNNNHGGQNNNQGEQNGNHGGQNGTMKEGPFAHMIRWWVHWRLANATVISLIGCKAIDYVCAIIKAHHYEQILEVMLLTLIGVMFILSRYRSKWHDDFRLVTQQVILIGSTLVLSLNGILSPLVFAAIKFLNKISQYLVQSDLFEISSFHVTSLNLGLWLITGLTILSIHKEAVFADGQMFWHRQAPDKGISPISGKPYDLDARDNKK